MAWYYTSTNAQAREDARTRGREDRARTRDTVYTRTPVLTWLRTVRIAEMAQEVVKFEKTEEEWKALLTPVEFKILRQKGTERPGTGEHDRFYPKKGEGHFVCAACKAPLYSAEAKFKSGCGWPAFDKCYTNSVACNIDTSHGMRRVEITCAACGGHLGHVFEGEKMTPTNERHCVNSVSVKFVKGDPDATEEEAVTKKL
jgi:peptide-methionine (R)-S-oxide reductase|eukprot:2209538-Prymnesium_polylepis.2